MLHRVHGKTYFASHCKGTRYCKCKSLVTLTSLVSLSCPPCCALCWKCWMRWLLPQASAYPADWPWVLEVRKDKKSFFLVNANYVFKRDVLILKGGRASLSALQFLSLRDSSLEPVASCCSSIHPESTEQILQKGLEAWGLPVLRGRGSCSRFDFHVFPHFSLLSHFKIKGCFY